MNARLIFRSALGVAVLVLAAACNSSNPNKPSMSFTTPLNAGPTSGTTYKYNEQPITLTITNAVRTGSGAVTYKVEVAKDEAFATIAYARDGIAEGSDTTSVQLPVLDGNTTYYWRWYAEADGVTGQPSAAGDFFVRPNVVLGKPQLLTPASNDAVYSTRPTFSVRNSTVTGPAGTIYYVFQVSAKSSFSPITATATVKQQSRQTSWTPTSDLPKGTLYWRVQATDPSNDVQSDFSAAVRFERKEGLNLNDVTYVLGPNIANWPQTAQITKAYHSGDQLCVYYTGPNWPSTDYFGDPSVQVVGNQWMFVQIGGKWYGGAGHWLRPGQYCKGEVDENFFIDGFQGRAPFNTLVLHPGDVFAVMISTPARMYPSMKTVDQRSDVVFVVW